MDKIIEILEGMHPEVDFNTCNTLIDDKSLIPSISLPLYPSLARNLTFQYRLRKSYRRILTPQRLSMP